MAMAYTTMKGQLVKAGVRFSHSIHSMLHEIPSVQDVLYALRLTDAQDCYEDCRNNSGIYNMNVHLAATACAFDVMVMQPYDEGKARQIVAETILELCPSEARCVEFPPYRAALVAAGETHPGPHTADCVRCKQFHEKPAGQLEDDEDDVDDDYRRDFDSWD